MNHERFIDLLLQANVLKFGDFTLKSGRKAPYFLNFGEIRTGGQLYRLAEFYADVFREKLGEERRILFGPAYKGIPLAVATSMKLKEKYDMDVPFCYNRKEKKDHGEGGSLVGEIPKSGDRITIIEDVVTAGTAIRETLDLLKGMDGVVVDSVILAVDRMEKGTGEQSTFHELESQYDIRTYSLTTIREILAYLHNRPVDGKIYIDDLLKADMLGYLSKYGGV